MHGMRSKVRTCIPNSDKGINILTRWYAKSWNPDWRSKRSKWVNKIYMILETKAIVPIRWPNNGVSMLCLIKNVNCRKPISVQLSRNKGRIGDPRSLMPSAITLFLTYRNLRRSSQESQKFCVRWEADHDQRSGCTLILSVSLLVAEYTPQGINF